MKPRLLPLLGLALLGATWAPLGAQTTNPDAEQPLVNISTRTTITADNPRVIVGFTVPAHPTKPQGIYPKTLVLRAVGPALADYGVDQPLADPRVQVFNAAGDEVSANWLYDFTQPVPTDNENETAAIRVTVAADVAAAAAAVGAFPVPVPTADELVVPDYSAVVGLPPGNYTIVVSSASGGTGDVVVEVYSLHN